MLALLTCLMVHIVMQGVLGTMYTYRRTVSIQTHCVHTDTLCSYEHTLHTCLHALAFIAQQPCRDHKLVNHWIRVRKFAAEMTMCRVLPTGFAHALSPS